MASETVVSEHPALSEEIEKKEQLEVKKMESENVSAQKEKPEEPACPAVAESEAKTIDEKQIEPPPSAVVVEHVKDDIVKADDEDTNKHVVVELPPVEDEKKTEPTEPIEQKTEDINRSVVELPPKEEEKDAPIPEQSIEKVESVVDEISECEPAGKQEEETKAGPTEETNPDEPAKHTVDAPEVIEEKIEKVEVESQTLPKEEKDDEVKEKNVPAEEAVFEIKEKAAEPGKIDESEKKSVLTEEWVQCEEKSTEGARISGPEPKAEEKAAEDQEVRARDIEQPVVEPEKTEENVDAIKTDVVQNQECAKEIEGDAKKDATPVKTQKQSIVKIVKQSLVKAKKAIIGKSQTSKTPDDGNK